MLNPKGFLPLPAVYIVNKTIYIMKITKLLLISLAVILFACGGEDEDPKPVTTDGLVGAWALTGLNYAGTSKTSTGGFEVAADFTGTGKDMNMTITFKENPATFTSQGKYTITLTTTTMGQSVTEDYPFEGFLTNGTWVLKGKVLTVTGTGGTQEATIIEQTSTTLKMEWNLTQTTSVQGVTVVKNVHGTYTFQKK